MAQKISFNKLVQLGRFSVSDKVLQPFFNQGCCSLCQYFVKPVLPPWNAEHAWAELSAVFALYPSNLYCNHDQYILLLNFIKRSYNMFLHWNILVLMNLNPVRRSCNVSRPSQSVQIQKKSLCIREGFTKKSVFLFDCVQMSGWGPFPNFLSPFH